MEKIMRKEMEEIREKVHTTADADIILCFQELNGSHSKVWSACRFCITMFRLRDTGNAASDEPDLWFARYAGCGSCMRSLQEEKDEWEFTEVIWNRQENTLPAGTERMVSIQIQFRQHCSLQGISDLRKAESRFPFGAGAFVSARRLSAKEQDAWKRRRCQ